MIILTQLGEPRKGIKKQGCRPVTPLTMAAALLLKSGFLRTSAKLPDVLIILFDCSVR